MKASDTVLTDEQLEENIRKDYKEFTIKEQSDEIQDILIWTREAQAKETLRQIVEWLEEDCPHLSVMYGGFPPRKHECKRCLVDLKSQIK